MTVYRSLKQRRRRGRRGPIFSSFHDTPSFLMPVDVGERMPASSTRNPEPEAREKEMEPADQLDDQPADMQTLKVQLERALAEVEAVREYYGRFRFRLVEKLHRVARHWPLAIPSLAYLVSVWRKLFWRRPEQALRRCIDRLLFTAPPAYWICKPEVRRALTEYLQQELAELLHQPETGGLAAWYRNCLPARLLDRFRSRRWPSYAPFFSVILLPRETPAAWRADSVASVRAQVYERWEMLGAVPSEADERWSGTPRLQPVPPDSADALRAALEQAQGDYVCWLDQGDVLEPHALYRFAEAALTHHADLLYSDEATTTANLAAIRSVTTRPQFSYDQYLCRPYFQHLVGMRTELLRQAVASNPRLDLQRTEDIILQALPFLRRVTHVPDFLYRQRGRAGADCGPAAARIQAVGQHLQALGCPAQVHDAEGAGYLDIRLPLARQLRAAILIPTKNRHDLLRPCIESLQATVPGALADIHVIDHESDDAESQAYLRELAGRHTVLRYQGPFNFSLMMNFAVHRLPPGYTHYLFLNNDIVAPEAGWLEHLLSLGQRADVGIVGALLLYPDGRVQHGGGVVGLHYAADHVYRLAPARGPDGRRAAGPTGALLATREMSLVTGACLLIQAEVFHQVGGFDEAFAVGFGDTDLCLRVQALGRKVLLANRAVLIHHESATRGKDVGDPHPLDTQAFRARYLQLILAGDPWYSPFLSRHSGQELNPFARAREKIRCRTVVVVPPRLQATATAAMRRAA
jgi:GT2 family glycosyltransferase